MTAVIEPLGIDNVYFTVTDLDAAVAFYVRCGFRRKLQIDAKRVAILTIGHETPGLVLSANQESTRGRLWVEVRDALVVAEALRAQAMQPACRETATGSVCEVSDVDGNVLGFVDYRQHPALARPFRDGAQRALS
jgi:catechol 2,3-dioxygenase-like lactoylglutathione lyase family enzyme